MANTYTQLYIQVVFAVQGRQNFIKKEFREELQKYITAVTQNDKHKMLAIYCMPDHVHVLTGLNPAISISDMVQDIKRAATNFINDKGFMTGHFNWQKGLVGFHIQKNIHHMLLITS